MLKLYGTPLCPDCVEAAKKLDEMGISYEYHDITGSTAELKAFLAIRDEQALFAPVKEAGVLGFPVLFKRTARLPWNLVPFYKDL